MSIGFLFGKGTYIKCDVTFAVTFQKRFFQPECKGEEYLSNILGFTKVIFVETDQQKLDKPGGLCFRK